MSARQLVVPFNFRPGARPWRRVLPRKALQAIDACGRFIQSPIVQVESRLLCYCASREPSPVACGALIFSSLQNSAGSVEIHPSGSDPGDHEIGAPHAVEHCPRADQRYARPRDSAHLPPRGVFAVPPMTVVQQELPIKIAVYDNGKLGFVEIEQKAEGMLDTFTKLRNPNFAGVARALGLWGETVSGADQLETAVKDWLAQPGPALLHVRVNPMQLVMPPFMQVEPAIGMALYSARAILHGRRGDVWEMAKENFL